MDSHLGTEDVWARHRNVRHRAVAKSPMDSLQDWLVLHQGTGVLGLATRSQQANRLQLKRQIGLRPSRDQVEMQRHGLRVHSFISL